ncbi:MAG: protein kinase [Planctomycetes bacterium]|nr:protein kinase [Planctomycetota bacterium]
MDVRLTVIEGPARGREFLFWKDERILVGRSFEARVSLPEDPSISRIHCALAIRRGECLLEDLGSGNGTTVNRRRVEQRALADGDVVRLGASALRFELAAVAPRPGSPAAPKHAGPVACARCDVEVAADVVTADEDGKLADGYLCRRCREALLLAPRPFDGYELAATLATTSASTLYRARERGAGGREVTLKVLHVPPELGPKESIRRVLRFMLEIEHLRKLDHPGIVRLYASGYDHGRIFLSMEFVSGGNLKQYVEAHKGPLTLLETSRIAVRILNALEHVHAKGIVHRDLKPENVLLAAAADIAGVGAAGGERGTGEAGTDPVVKLADLGLAKCVEAGAFGGITLTSESGGTLEYMPPDQVTDFSTPSPAFDLFAAAATIQFALTGRSIYRRVPDTTAEMLEVIHVGERVDARELRPDLPEDAAEALARGLARSPADRPSLAELAAPFRRILADPTGLQGPTLERPPRRRGKGRRG